MIKCNVTVCGTISRAAVVRTSKDGKSFVAYSVSVIIPARNGINKTLEIGVVKNGAQNDTSSYVQGKRVKIEGELTFKKRGEALYFNLSETTVDVNTSETEDSIKGDMYFRGSAGKNIEEKNDKNGKPYLAFSAYSGEKVSDGFEYIWVRFIRFSEEHEDWLVAKATLEAKGELEVSVYNDRLNLGCRLTELKRWEKQPYQANQSYQQRTNDDNLPF